ncbi:MAG TPA: hypothetical protein VG929_02150 [Actinomycetota bacterium]|nr:hypothetical protein [Actinomycetota bacterium]
MIVDLAHGVGRVYEAPLPVWLYGVGAAITVLLSFVLRAVVKTEPVERPPRLLVDARASAVVVRVLRVAALVGLFLAILAGVLVRDRGLSFAPLWFWIALIIGVAAVNALVSGYWGAVDPWRTIEGFYRLEAPEATSVPSWWVGPVLLYGLFWFELVSGIGFDAVPVVGVLLAYSLFVFTFRARWGDRWSETDPLSLLFGFAGACAPLRLDERGLRYRGWLTELDRPEQPSKPVFASLFVLLGATTLDNVRETTHWHQFLEAARVGDVPSQIVDSLALVLFAGVFLLPYALTMWVTARSIRADARIGTEMRHFAWSLIPIGVAYLLAHNAPLLMIGVPRLIAALSDPFERGWNLFGTATAFSGYLPSPALVWFIEIALIIGGHVLGVLTGHRIALRRAGGHEAAVRSQIALTVLMSIFTVGTLVLLGQPLVA